MGISSTSILLIQKILTVKSFKNFSNHFVVHGDYSWYWTLMNFKPLARSIIIACMKLRLLPWLPLINHVQFDTSKTHCSPMNNYSHFSKELMYLLLFNLLIWHNLHGHYMCFQYIALCLGFSKLVQLHGFF